jgi:hypothetical protein
MRRDCQPHFVDAEGNLVSLRRVDFGDRKVGESFLQEQLHKSPSILPVEELDDSFAPLLSLGREIELIDNLFISPTGRITIVETKLWRNPEATREVLAQILGYAKHLSSLRYEEFEKKCRSAQPPAPLANIALYGLVSKRFPKQVTSESDFRDTVNKNLRTARFMLLIVGDGIRENLEDMLGLFQHQPQMLFTFGLVEMQIYESASIPGRLIVPHLIARTNEILRAVVRVENRADVDVSVSLPLPGPKGSGRTITIQEFLDGIKEPRARGVFANLIDFANEIGYVRRTRHTIQAAMEYKGTGFLKFFGLGQKNQAFVSVIPLDQQLRERGVDEQIAIDTANRLAELFPQVGLEPGTARLAHRLKAIEVEEKVEEFKDVFRDAVAGINALEPTARPSALETEAEEDDEDVASDGIEAQ